MLSVGHRSVSRSVHLAIFRTTPLSVASSWKMQLAIRIYLSHCRTANRHEAEQEEMIEVRMVMMCGAGVQCVRACARARARDQTTWKVVSSCVRTPPSPLGIAVAWHWKVHAAEVVQAQHCGFWPLASPSSEAHDIFKGNERLGMDGS